VEDFIENLKIEKVFNKMVWVDTTRKTINEHVEQVTFQASAVLEIAGGESLLQYGGECGFDKTDGDPERDGTEIAKLRRKKISDWCEVNGLTVKPGLVDM
jgi:hypothetical protein